MWRRISALIAASTLVSASGLTAGCSSPGPAVITGPFASLLASSTGLGPSSVGDAQLTVALSSSARPDDLMGWASARNLWVRWRSGDEWAIVEGAGHDLAQAFGVPVNDYRGRKGQIFYASTAAAVGVCGASRRHHRAGQDHGLHPASDEPAGHSSA